MSNSVPIGWTLATTFSQLQQRRLWVRSHYKSAPTMRRYVKLAPARGGINLNERGDGDWSSGGKLRTAGVIDPAVKELSQKNGLIDMPIRRYASVDSDVAS